jgi:hypothetical protein
MTNLYCIGLESSGRKWVQNLISQNPAVCITGTSIPAGYAPDRAYLPIEVQDDLVVVTRDQNCRLRGVSEQKYNAGCEGRFQEYQNVGELLRWVAAYGEAGKPVVWVSYEAMLTFRQSYLSWVFRQLGLPDHEAKIEARDGNAKYLKTERERDILRSLGELTNALCTHRQ